MQRIDVIDGDETVPVHVARPDGDPVAGLVVVQEAFGVNDHIKDVCGRFAAEGYVVAAPSLFHRFDREVLGYDEIDVAKALLPSLTVEQVTGDVAAARRWLQGDAGARDLPVAVIGYCFGGRVSFLAAVHHPGWAAAVCYYGGGIGAEAPGAPIERAADLSCPVQAVYGALDPMIPPAEVARVRSALERSPLDHEVLVYDDASHGFFCDARPASYHADAAADVWPRTLAFLARHTGAHAAAG